MREKLIELLNNSFDKQYSKRGLLTAPHTADDLIASGVVVSKMETTTKWIPVTERLPDEHRLVLCRWTRGIGASYGFARYNHDHDVWYVSNEGMPEVTHWMPLPEPPKGE